MTQCAGCEQKIVNRQYLTCSTCKKYYDLECSNVSKEQHARMTSKCRLTWECQECRCRKPKNNNINTPVRSQQIDVNLTIPDPNVTQRQKTTQNHLNETFCSEDISILGETLYHKRSLENENQPELTLHNLSEMITMKLKENNTSIILEIRATIQSEINKAILKLKEDIKQDTGALFLQNEQRKNEIEKLNIQIEKLEKQTEAMQTEIKKLNCETPRMIQHTPENNVKKIVLYGLNEIYNEPEEDLHERIRAIFWEVLEVDVLGYIEDTYRIGRYYKNRNRPMVIELMSKRMTKYITENGRYFQGTGLFTSEFLNQEARNERKVLRDKMLVARNKGQQAVIRNNQLYIEGELISYKDETISYPPPINENQNNSNRKSGPYKDHTFREYEKDTRFRKPRATF